MLIHRRGVAGLKILALALVAVHLGGCKKVDEARANRRCDQDRLAALATELDGHEPDARVMLVSEGLLEACGDELYPTVRAVLTEVTRPRADARLRDEDAAYGAAIQRICPAHARIGEVMSEASIDERGPAIAKLCGFDRYELLGEDELRELGGHALFVWATHDFLLESGTPAEVARTISRALVRVHDVVFAPVLLQPPVSLEPIAASAAAPVREGPVVYISHAELVFNEQPLATLERGRLPGDMVRGHMIIPLYDALGEEGEKIAALRSARGEGPGEPVLLLFVGAGVTFGTVVDAMYTAGRLEYAHFDFVVEPIAPVKRALRIDPPNFADLGDIPEEIPGEEPPPRPPGPPFFKVFVLDDGYRVSRNAGETVHLPKLDPKSRAPEAWDQAGLAKLVREQTAANPKLREGTLSAENTITMDVVLATYAVLLGPDCEQHEDGAGCLLPQLVLEAGAG